MADSTKSKSTPQAPSFYSAAASMDGYGAKPGAKGGAGGQSGQAQTGEKVQNVKVLLEVFAKMDKLEQDAESKALIQQMSDIAKQYLDKIEGGDKGAGKKGPEMEPPTGEAGSGAGGMSGGTGMTGGADGSPTPGAGMAA